MDSLPVGSVTQKQNLPHPCPTRGNVSVKLFRDFFKKIKVGEDASNDDDDDDDDKVKGKSNDGVSTSAETVDEKSVPIAPQKAGEKAATPLFANQYLNNALENRTEKTSDGIKTTANEPVPAVIPVEEKKEKEVLSPMAQAESLRAQAARIRLEADKRQVELTLEKIAKLEIRLERLKGKEKVDATDQKSLQEELLRLKAQLATDEGGEVKLIPPMSNDVAAKATSSSSSFTRSSENFIPPSPTRPSLSASELEERVKRFRDAPEFMQILVAKMVGSDDKSSADMLNATEIVQKLYDDEMNYIHSDFRNKSEEQNAREMIERAYRNSRDEKDDDGNDKYNDMPIFTEEQIQAKVKELEDIPQFLKSMVIANETELATMLLEDEWVDKNKKKKSKGGFFGLFSGDTDNEKGEIGRDGERLDIGGTRGAFSRMFSDESSLNGTSYGQPRSDVDFMMNSLYPQSTRKEGQTPEKRLVDAFLNDIVAPTKAFTPSDNPLPVNGGWVSEKNHLVVWGNSELWCNNLIHVFSSPLIADYPREE